MLLVGGALLSVVCWRLSCAIVSCVLMVVFAVVRRRPVFDVRCLLMVGWCVVLCVACCVLLAVVGVVVVCCLLVLFVVRCVLLFLFVAYCCVLWSLNTRH